MLNQVYNIVYDCIFFLCFQPVIFHEYFNWFLIQPAPFFPYRRRHAELPYTTEDMLNCPILQKTCWLDLPVWRSLSLSFRQLRKLLSSDFNCNHSVMRNPGKQIRTHHTWVACVESMHPRRSLLHPTNWPLSGHAIHSDCCCPGERSSWSLSCCLDFFVCVIPHCWKKGHRGSWSMIDSNR